MQLLRGNTRSVMEHAPSGLVEAVAIIVRSLLPFLLKLLSIHVFVLDKSSFAGRNSVIRSALLLHRIQEILCQLPDGALLRRQPAHSLLYLRRQVPVSKHKSRVPVGARDRF